MEATSTEEYVRGIRAADRMVLGRAITLVESTLPAHRWRAAALLDACLPLAGNSLRIGVTGVPGAGKSTFIDALGGRLIAGGRRVAVLAVDPTSQISGGSILGDKTRMPHLSSDPNAFVRPSPSGGMLGGVSRRTRDVIVLCEAAGFDTIFVETVGVGQAETAVSTLVDFVLLLALAGAGDELQSIKRGIVEMADAVVVTKADSENKEAARRARMHFHRALRLLPPSESGWRPCVHTCSAVTGEGLDEVWQTIRDYERMAGASSHLSRRRMEQARAWLRETLEDRLREAFFSRGTVREALERLERDVMDGKISATAAADEILRLDEA